jgi:hypothetical protein
MNRFALIMSDTVDRLATCSVCGASLLIAAAGPAAARLFAVAVAHQAVSDALMAGWGAALAVEQERVAAGHHRSCLCPTCRPWRGLVASLAVALDGVATVREKWLSQVPEEVAG